MRRGRAGEDSAEQWRKMCVFGLRAARLQRREKMELACPHAGVWAEGSPAPEKRVDGAGVPASRGIVCIGVDMIGFSYTIVGFA